MIAATSNFLGSLFQRRWFWWVCLSLLIPLALLTLALGYINQEGNRRWREFEQRMAREGETMDFRSLLAPAIPEQENFCAVPPLLYLALHDESAEGRQGDANRERIKRLFEVFDNPFQLPRVSSGAAFGAPIDFRPWAEWMRKKGAWPVPATPGDPARDVLAGFAEQEAFFAELAPAAGRPRAQWVPAWSMQTLPSPLLTVGGHLGSVHRLQRALSLRAALALQLGDSQAAFETVAMMARLAEANADCPTVANLGGGDLMSGAVWEIVNAGLGSADDWERLEKECASQDLRARGLRCFRGEMAIGVDMMQYSEAHRRADATENWASCLWTQGYPAAALSGRDRTLLAGALMLLPRGAFHGSAAERGQAELDDLILPLRDHGLAKQASLQMALNRAAYDFRLAPLQHPWKVHLSFSLSMIGGMSAKLLYWQTKLNQAVIACVLERHRLRHGSYPEKLDGLMLSDGRPLPLDPALGLPMRYRRTPNGRYTLWSIGRDGVDDDGQRGKRDAEERLDSPTFRGDWIWDFTPKTK